MHVPELPARVARHFPEPVDLSDPRGRAAVVARLLEDGDRADLAWLAARVPEVEISSWFGRHGARRLSRRSRAFWAAVLDVEPARGSAAAGTSDTFWPLA
jgi:hypothetical protein